MWLGTLCRALQPYVSGSIHHPPSVINTWKKFSIKLLHLPSPLCWHTSKNGKYFLIFFCHVIICFFATKGFVILSRHYLFLPAKGWHWQMGGEGHLVQECHRKIISAQVQLVQAFKEPSLHCNGQYKIYSLYSAEGGLVRTSLKVLSKGGWGSSKMIISLHLGWLPQDFLEPGLLLVPIPSCVIGSADGDDSAILAKWFMISSHDLVDHNCKENQTVLLSNAPTHKSPHYCKWHNIFGFTALNCIRHDLTDNIRRQRNLITLSFHREL